MAIKLSITAKLISYLVAVSLVPLLLFAINSYQGTRETIVQLATEYSSQLLANQRDYLQLQTEQIESLAANIAGVEDISTAAAYADEIGFDRHDSYTELSTQAKIGYILNGYNNLKGLVSLDLFTVKGHHFHVGDTLSVASVRDDVRLKLYNAALASDQPILWLGVEDNINIQSTSRKVITAIKIIRHYSIKRQRTESVGMLMINYSTNYLYNHFSTVDLGKKSYLMVVDSESRLIYHPDKAMIGQQLLPEFSQLFTSAGGTRHIFLDGEEVLFGYASLPRTGWRVVAVIPEKTLLLPMDRVTKNALALLFICLAIIGFMSFQYSRSVVGPIKAISNGFRKIQENHQTRIDPLPIPKTKDEIGEMVYWFNAFLEAMQARQKSDQLIWHQANFDMLTGLPNRFLFRDRLETEIQKAYRSGLALALLFIDLDRFKIINDTLGHDAGDSVLKEAAHRIRNSVRACDTVARLGGDEFIVILSALNEAVSIESLVKKILDTLAEPFHWIDEKLFLSASIGISLYPTDANESDGLLKNADLAMYAAKTEGRNRYRRYIASMHEDEQARLRLSNDLRDALAAGQLEVHFQPIVEIPTGRIVKAEALLRWHHLQRGMISPAEFIPVAEEYGLINDIEDWVFRQSVSYVQRWSERLGQPFQVSVNISPTHFLIQEESIGWAAYLNEIGVPGNYIAIEITERLLLHTDPIVHQRLRQYRDAGIQMSIDDFGTGYSSLSYLKKFDIDFLKIDQSFVRDMTTDASDRAIVEAIIVMAHKIGLKVIAEGVETSAQRDLLSAIGCNFYQGWLFSKALPAEAFEAMLVENRNGSPIMIPSYSAPEEYRTYWPINEDLTPSTASESNSLDR